MDVWCICPLVCRLDDVLKSTAQCDELSPKVECVESAAPRASVPPQRTIYTHPNQPAAAHTSERTQTHATASRPTSTALGSPVNAGGRGRFSFGPAQASPERGGDRRAQTGEELGLRRTTPDRL